MNKILVPVDFSKHSEYALEVAAAFAKAYDAEILVMHMMGLSDSIFAKDESQEVAEAIYHMKLAEKQFQTFLDKPYLNGITVTETVQNYKIFEEINDLALEQDVDLVIMGSHGAKGLREEFVGSNTERVVRTSEVPVLVVKGNEETALPKRVLYACDFKEESVKAYRDAIPFFEELEVKIDLVYVNLPADRFRSSREIEDKMEKFMSIAEFGTPLHREDLVIVNGYSIESGLYEYATKVGADALAIPTHGRRGLSHFFNGSIAEAIANHSKLPVFTFKM
ncbi:universal stress protein [Dokdonia sinensis]|uniref:Universal stress protein n=1 Tax=Dokdonia sinensis TaxID=2479847 RepID=A0A3M0GQZ3_9FLAO|nr:universal stress protein [Dokdonia sinensis]RMB64123.1 universal stress protein [Dokdonia sinensis]